MAIDLNGTLAGVNNTIAYTEGGASISIAPAARVGAGSTSINSDQWVQIKVTMLNPQAGDLWSIKSLPLGMSVSSTSGGAPLPLPVDVSIVTSPVLYLNGGLFTTDSAWQTALAAIRYRDAGEVLPGESARQIDVLGRTSTGNGPTASVMVNMVPVNDAPVANADSGSALEAGGINNSTAGRPASGNVLMNDRDPDSAASSLRVIGVSQAGTAVPAGTAISGAYGWLVIQADGSYVYRVIDSLPIVQALRTGTQTLSESFTYTVQDDAGATSQAALTVTIAGRNDTPVATADAGMAVEQGESDPGRSASGNVLANDWDVDAGDALTVVSAGLVGQAAVGTGTALVGRYGTLTVAANGDYVYTADDSIPAVQALRGPGDTLADTFVYTVRDLAGATRSNTLTLTISGRNDAPVAEADEAIAVEAGGWRNGTLGVDPNGNVLANDRDPDGGDTFSVDIVSFGTRTGQVGQALQGAHGTLWLNADGSYRYAVNQTDPAVQALRRASDTLSETFSYGMRDAAGARSTATLTVTVRGQDDTPVGVGFGAVFDGTTATALCAGEDPGARRDFAIVFTATPMSTIVLHHNEGGHVDPLNSGQHFAIAPQRQSAWGDLNHASVGVSVGSNGVSVYADNGALTPLLTWAGEVQPQTRIAVIVQDNRPTLIIDGEVVRLGVSTPLQLHPGTQLGASAEHPADGFIGGLEGVRIWDGHYTPGSLALRELTSAAGSPGLLGQALNPQVSENAIAGTVVARAHTWDVDQGDSATYSLVDDANGRFVVNASTGVLSVADGARFDHETQPQVSVRVRSTDLSGQWTEQTLRIGVADANDAPTSAASSATMAEDNQIRLRATALGADPITNDQAGPPRVRLDEVPDALQGTLRLNGVAVAAGQVIAAADVARLAFQPRLFHVGAFAFDDQDTGDGLSAVRLDTLPAAEQGLLTYQGQPVVAGLVVPADRLGDLSFEPVRDFNGIVTFRYSVCDWQGTFQATPGTFSLTVTAVNDTPAIAPVLTMDVREGGTTRLDGIRLNDVDAAGDEMVLTLRVSEGKLSANATPEVVVQGNGSDTLQLRGTLQALNALVQSEPGISYAAPHHEPPALNCTLMRLDNDPQAIDPLVRLVLSTQAGHLQAIGREGVTVSGSGTDCLSIEGLASVVEAFVQDEQSVKRLVPHPMAELTVTLDDQGHTGTDPGFTGTDLNEQDTRVMGLVLVPQGLPLATTEPTPDTGTAAPTHNTGLDPAAMAGVAAGTPLVIALGLQDRLRSVFVTGTADTVSQLQTTAARIELAPESHSLPAAGHTLTLSQLLYDGQRTEATVSAAQTRVQLEQLRLSRRLNERLLAMREALHNQEAAAARRHHAHDALRDIQTLNALVQQKRAAGLLALVDVRRAESRLLEAQRSVTEADARWQEALLTLAGETGLPVPPHALHSDPFVALPPEALDALGLTCAQACPEVREAALQVDRAQAELRAAEAAWHPRLSLELSRSDSRNLSGSAEHYRSASAFVKLNWALYDGGQRSAQTRRLGHDIQAQENTLEEMRRTVSTRWSVGRSRLQASAELHAIALRNATVARQARELAEQGLRAGLRSPIELADTVNEETRALDEAASRDAERRIAQDRLLALTGLLAQHLGLVPGEP